MGASAWNPPPASKQNRSHRSISPPSKTHNNKGQSPTFRLLTNAGTHLFCTAQTVADRDIWLSALHSGMEITYAGYEDTLATLKKLANSATLDFVHDANDNIAPPRPPTSLVPHDHHLEPNIMIPPVPNRSSTESVNPKSHSNIHSTTVHLHNATFLNPYESDSGTISKSHCLSCGRFPPESAMRPYSGTPLLQYGMENKISVCQSCLIGQGVLRHVMHLKGLYACDAHERVALIKGREIAIKAMERAATQNDDSALSGLINSNLEEGMEILAVTSNDCANKLENIVMTPQIHSALLNLTNNVSFTACRRRSSALDGISMKLENGVIGTAEFLELLNEYAQEALMSSSVQTESISMKKEALMVAGDMRAAIQMLHEHALPKDISSTTSLGKTEMLSCALEFFLDLCEQGEILSVAFFWPQICHIHLQMLPATDSESLARIELVEDFLLTVSVRYSVHLALELVWGCLADLEESLGSGITTNALCRRRRFHLIRFICELESLIFDLDGGWGAGGCSLRGAFLPNDDQALLIKTAFGLLQMHRTFSSHHLSRSARLDKLNAEMKYDSVEQADEIANDSIAAAKRKYYIARSAEYFSTQLMFCRRLGDIAETLRFTELDHRTATLEKELEILNASGRLGGDPLNAICKQGEFINVMSIPQYEGHVFRSKERTPILLLMETILEKNILDSHEKQEESEKIVPSSIVDAHEIEGETEIFTELLSPKGKLMSCIKSINVHVYVSNVTQVISQSKFSGILKSPRRQDGSQIQTVGSMEEVADVVETKLKLQIPDIGANFEKSQNDLGSEDNTTNLKQLDSLEDGVQNIDIESLDSDAQGMTFAIDAHRSTAESENLQSDANEDMHDVFLDEGEKDGENITDSMTDIRYDNNGHSILVDARVSKSDSKEIAEAVESKEDHATDSLHNLMQSNLLTSMPANNSDVLQAPVDTSGDEINKNGETSNRSLSLTKKVSAFGAFKVYNNGESNESTNLSAHGEGRREVLTAIFTKGMRSNNAIARRVAPAARRAIQAMDRKRAQLLLGASSNDETDSRNVYGGGSGVPTSLSEESQFMTKPTEEEECIESIRLLLVQNSVALGKISIEKAANVLNKASEVKPKKNRFSAADECDPGLIDSRLAGCGTVSEAVMSALKLWTEGLVRNGELLDLVQKDLYYTKLALPGSENESKLMEDSVFWGRFAFGERWAEKKARIQASSEFGNQDDWDLTGLIVKSNDDLRQEAFAMQLIELSAEVFQLSGLELWVHPYRILATGKTTGIIEMVRNAMSFDSLKKRPGYSEGGNLVGHFKKMSEFAADPTEALKASKKNFVSSLAAYSLLSYFFEFKDRHNGNLLLDTAGHVIHIDFGFIFGIAPGGSFSLEQGVPFKLTDEMVNVMDGLGSPLFSEFVTLFCCGFLALQEHYETFTTIVDVTCQGSTFKCFEGRECSEVVSKLKERFRPELNKVDTITHAMELIRLSYNATGTTQYDFFQYMSQGIAG